VVLLENLRFDPREEADDPEFASELGALADVYVDDAFGTAHRAHASTEGVTHYLPAVSGLLLARELEMLGSALESPERPFAAILGGAKVSDKIAVLENLAGTVDLLVVGGGMAATFMLAKGLDVGDSLVEQDRVPFARRFIDSAGDKGTRLMLPVDVVVADSFSEEAACRTVDDREIPEGWRIMDIGLRSADAFVQELSRCRTVVWNGPMGVFEWEPFSGGTARVAEALAGLEDAVTIVGGGSTAEAVERFGVAGRMTHVSTGGGASLELLEGKTLPGVEALLNAD
jgi:phosphoglycerate kinase